MIGVGIIGYGYWGPNFVRNVAEATGARVQAVCDSRSDRLFLVTARYPGVRTTTDPSVLIADPAVGAVAIATPVSTHFDFAMKALAAGKHVLVSKPIAATVAEASRLIDEAERRRLVLMVDHTFVYTGAVRTIRDLVAGGQLGEVYYYDSVRVNLGLFQHDVSVIWDLAVHDLSVLDFVVPDRPCRVSATGIAHVAGQPENTAYVTLFFADRLIAHVHVNWLAPVKIRQTLIGGSQRMIVYDDLEPSEKVKVYDRGISVSDQTTEGVYNLLVSYRTGDMWAPRIDPAEALQREIGHFVECINGGQRPATDGQAGLRVVRILEAASQSMREQGRPVDLT